MFSRYRFLRQLFWALLLVSSTMLVAETSAHFPYQQEKDKTAADRAFREARRLFEQGTPEALRASINKFQEASDLFRAAGDQASATVMLLFIGRTYFDLGEKQKTVEIMSQSQVSFHGLGIADLEATALSIMGGAYLDLGNNQQALDSYNHELAILESIGDKNKQAMALSNIGHVYYSMGDKEKALTYYDKAIRFVNDVDNSAIKARLYGTLGELYAEMGMHEFSDGFLKVAIGIYKRLGDEQEANRLTSVLDKSRAEKDAPKTVVARKAGLSGKPELSIQLGHSNVILAISFSPDGKYILTGSQDSTARLWETSTGLEVKKFEGHRAVILAVAFTPDGRYAMTGSLDGTLRQWDIATGEEVRRFNGEKDEFTAVAVSHDGTKVAAGNGATVRYWDLTTAKELYNIPMPSRVNSVAFAPDDKRIVVGTGGSLDSALVKEWMLKNSGKSDVSDEEVSTEVERQSRLIKHEVVMYETGTGREVWRFRSPSSPVNAVDYSSDGRFVLSASGGMEAGDNVARLFDSSTGRELRSFSHDNKIAGPEPLVDLSFSPDGRQALIIGVASARLWDLTTGAEIRRFERGASDPFCGAFSHDGLIALAFTQVASLYEASTGKLLRSFEGYAFDTGAMAISQNGRYIATGNYHVKDANHVEAAGTVCLWDITSGEEVGRFEGHESNINSLVFSADSRFLLTGSNDLTARLWDVETGKEKMRFVTQEDERTIFSTITSVALSRDARFALTGSETVVLTENGTGVSYARVWETATGRELTRLPHQYGINSVSFSPDDRFVLTGSGGAAMISRGTLEYKPRESILWDRRTGLEIRRFAGNRAIFSDDGKLVLTAGADNAAHLFETETASEVRVFKGHKGEIEALAFSADGNLILTSSLDKTTRVWNVAKGETVYALAGQEGNVNSVAFSADSRFLFTLADDSIVRVWNRESGDELCRLISFRDGTWVSVDPYGRFDTNNLEQIRGLHWLIRDDPMKPLPLEIFMREYYEPRLAQRLMSGEKLTSAKSLADLNRLQPAVKITSIERAQGQSDKVEVIVKVAQASDQILKDNKTIERKTDVYDVRLFRDGQLVAQAPSLDSVATQQSGEQGKSDDLAVWRKNTKVKLDATGKATITFENIRVPHSQDVKQVEFSAYAFNVDKVKSLTDRKSYDLPQNLSLTKGRAYIIAVGVNAYENSDFDLEFAADDARRMASMVTEKLNAAGQFETVTSVTLISDYQTKEGRRTVVANQATKEKFRAMLDLLAGKNVDRRLLDGVKNADQLQKATPDDLVLIMYSSHGYADRAGNFYFIPYDTGPGKGKVFTESVRMHSISSDELSLWLRDVDAGEMIMIVDACHSSAAIEGSDFKPGPMGSRGLGQLSYDKGMQILTATQSDNVALENNLIKQGLLTYALVRDGIEARQADFKPKDNVINISEWLSYGVDRVPKLYEEVQAGKIQDFGIITVQKTKAVLAARAGKSRGKSLDEVVIEAKAQQPSLFDFTRKRREVALVK